MNIREKLEELEKKTIKARSAYMNSGNPEDADGLIWEGQAWDVDQEIVTAYEALEAENELLKDRLRSSVNLCLWCKHRGTDECVDCVFFDKHKVLWSKE